MPLRGRRTRVVLPLAALVALAACSSDSPVAPGITATPGGRAADDLLIARLAASAELSALASPAAQRTIAEAERMVRGEPRGGGGFGPQPPAARAVQAAAVPPVDPSLAPGTIVGLLFQVTILVYQHGFFADATGDLRLDRALAIIHPIHYAALGVGANDADQTIAGLEATIEWYEQRSAEGLVPNEIAQWLIDYANVAIDKLGGSNTTRTMCLSSAERSCVTADLKSVRWILSSLQTRLRHDFAYTFLDGEPAQIEVRFRLATGAPGCNILGAPIETSSDAIWTVIVRQEPTLTANPNTGGFTPFGCVAHGIIRGFQWDGLVVRDAEGAVLGSCGKSSGDPCFEPAN